MNIQEIKKAYQEQAAIYNKNLKHIRLQLSRQILHSLMVEYSAEYDSNLAKILTLRGIKIY